MIGRRWDMHSAGEVVRLYLHDPHQEYTGSLVTQASSAVFPSLNAYLVAQVVWDDMALIEAFCDSRDYGDMSSWDAAQIKIGETRTQLFPDWDPTWDGGVVWQIEGNLAGLSLCFDSLAEALDTTISGDDDVFDYWPNTMTMLQEFAKDLDTLEGQSNFAAKVHEVYHKVKERFEAGNPQTSIKFDEEVWNPNGA